KNQTHTGIERSEHFARLQWSDPFNSSFHFSSRNYTLAGRNVLLVASLGLFEKFPLLQRNRDIAVFPNKIMKGAKIEFVSLVHARVGEEFHDLQFADLIRDCLARPRGERGRFLARGLFVHWDFLV